MVQDLKIDYDRYQTRDDSGVTSVNSRTPLLTEGVSKSTGTGTGIANSARQYKTTHSSTAGDKDVPTLSFRPVKVRNVDKRIKDHISLYNDHVDRFSRLQEVLVSLREMYHPDPNHDKTLTGCFLQFRTLAKGNIVLNRRYQYCMELEASDPKIMPPSAHPVITLFNTANRLTKDILDKSPGIISSVELVVQSERDLRREVLVASLGEDGPQSMKNCLDNVADLKRVSLLVEDIKRKTIRDFEELKSAAQALLESEDNK